MKKNKIYKNSNRNSNHKIDKYVPQYKIHGITPMPLAAADAKNYSLDNFSNTDKDLDNPRIKSYGIPYASTESFNDLSNHEATGESANLFSEDNCDSFIDEDYLDMSLGNGSNNILSLPAAYHDSDFHEGDDSAFDFDDSHSHDYVDDENNHETSENIFTNEARNVIENEYVLLFNEHILGVGNSNFIRLIIKDIITGKRGTFMDVPLQLEDLTLFKKIKISFDISIE